MMKQQPFNLDSDLSLYELNLVSNIQIYLLQYCELNESLISLMKQDIIDIYPNFSGFSSNKQAQSIRTKLKEQEFIVSRWLYKKLMKDLDPSCQILIKDKFGCPISYGKRLVSLSHKRGSVLLAVSDSYQGLGVDIEMAVNPKLASKILTDQEQLHSLPLDEELKVALVFSFKESLYKAICSKFHQELSCSWKDFEIISIDLQSTTLQASLSDKLVRMLPKLQSSLIEGRFKFITIPTFQDIKDLASHSISDTDRYVVSCAYF